MNLDVGPRSTIRSLDETELDHITGGFDVDRTLAFVAATAFASGAGAVIGAAAITALYLRHPDY